MRKLKTMSSNIMTPETHMAFKNVQYVRLDLEYPLLEILTDHLIAKLGHIFCSLLVSILYKT